MKAVGYTHCHPIEHDDALEDLVLASPHAPKGHDLLVEIKAVSVNPVDTRVRRSADPAGDPRILGYDAAGIVRARGDEASLFAVGQEVMFAGVINRPGSNAEMQLVDERLVGHKPAKLGFAEAAALPLTALTAWEALFERLAMPRTNATDGTGLLIVGGAGGVGSIAIQLANRLTGATVIATASRPETKEWCKTLGADHVVDHGEDLAQQVKALGVPVTRILSTTHSGDHWNALAEIIAPHGTICVIDEIGDANVALLKNKSATLAWEYMFTRGLHQTADMIEQHKILDEVARLVDGGVLRTTATENLGKITAANLKRAHAVIESGSARGKLVLEGF